MTQLPLPLVKSVKPTVKSVSRETDKLQEELDYIIARLAAVEEAVQNLLDGTIR